MTADDGRADSVAHFIGWAAVGACLASGFLLAFTVGPLGLLAGLLIATALTLRARKVGMSLVGIGPGAGLGCLVVAYSNRHGPGMYCYKIAGGGECDQQWNPLPWLCIGVVVMAAGIVVFAVLKWAVRRDEPDPPPGPVWPVPFGPDSMETF